MKWTIPNAKFMINHLVQRYIDTMDVDMVRHKNQFDIGRLHQNSKEIIHFKFTHYQTQILAEVVYEILNIKDFSSMEP